MRVTTENITRTPENIPKVGNKTKKKSFKIFENRALTLQKSTLNPPKSMPRRCSKKDRIQTPSWGAHPSIFFSHFSDFEASWLPRWPQVGGQDGPKVDKKSIPKSMKILSRLGTPEFSKIFDFGGQHGSKLASKSDLKSMLTSRDECFENHCFS